MAGVDARGESDMAGAGGTVTGLDRALSYALGRLEKAGMVLKPEQKAAIRHI